MKIKQHICPECGGIATGTLELLPGVAGLDIEEDGSAEYSGETDVQWDNQTTVMRDGKYVLTCHNGHEWTSEIEGING